MNLPTNYDITLRMDKVVEEKTMIIFKSKNGIPIRLTKEKWTRIVNRHQEMNGQKRKILEVVYDLDIIQEGDFGELIAVRF